MNPAITMQVITQAFLWIFVLSYEMVGEVVIGFIPPGHWMFLGACGFATFGFFLMGRLGDNALLRDMRELFLYDIIVHAIGAGLRYANEDMIYYQILISALTILKFGRLLWLHRKADFGNEAGWPVFGCWVISRPEPVFVPDYLLHPWHRAANGKPIAICCWRCCYRHCCSTSVMG